MVILGVGCTLVKNTEECISWIYREAVCSGPIWEQRLHLNKCLWNIWKYQHFTYILLSISSALGSYGSQQLWCMHTAAILLLWISRLSPENFLTLPTTGLVAQFGPAANLDHLNQVIRIRSAASTNLSSREERNDGKAAGNNGDPKIDLIVAITTIFQSNSVSALNALNDPF